MKNTVFFFVHFLKIFHQRFILLLMSSILLFILLIENTQAQNFIIHSGWAKYEDGKTGKDADADSNGVIVWASGKIHVVAGYKVNKGYKLLIESGAIVKICSYIQVDTLGNIQYITYGGEIVSDSGIIQIDGAVITDMRDDSEGGDTNQDGGATQPAEIKIEFSNTSEDYIRNSRLNYVYLLNIGSMDIENSQFDQFNGIIAFDDWSSSDDFPSNHSPYIYNNSFELKNRDRNINLLGFTPIFSYNKIYYPSGTDLTFCKTSLEIGGLKYANNTQVAPITGYIKIFGNTFLANECVDISYHGSPNPCIDAVFEGIVLNVIISDNTFTAVNNVSTNYGISAPAQANVVISRNKMQNFPEPVKINFCSNPTYSGILINSNWFMNNNPGSSRISFSFSSPPLFFIDARRNYWADPSGPRDFDYADGLLNPFGQGMWISQYIDYSDFIGGTSNKGEDKIRITAETIDPIPGLPLVHGTDASIKVIVDEFNLASANTGKIFASLKDDQGYLDHPGVEVNISAASHSAELPTLNFEVPLITKTITVQAVLMPDGDSPGTPSNTVPIKVESIPSSIAVIECKPIPTPDQIYLGNTYNFNVKVKYTLTSGNGNIELNMDESSDVAVLSRKSEKIPVQATTDATIYKTINVVLGLNELGKKEHKLGLAALLSNDADQLISADRTWSMNVHEAGYMYLPNIAPGNYNSGIFYEYGRNNFYEGDELIFKAKGFANIFASAQSDLQIVLEKVQYFNFEGDFFSGVTLNKTCTSPITSGYNAINFNIDCEHQIPVGARKGKLYFILVKPPITVLDRLECLFDVKVLPSKEVNRQVSIGSSDVYFDPIPISLNISQNPNETKLTADEFSSPFDGLKNSYKSIIFQKSEYSPINFIPINRYWSIYGTQNKNTIKGNIKITYDPQTDFPSSPEFFEDSLVITALNPMSGELTALTTILNKSDHSVAADYNNFFETFVVAVKRTGNISDISIRQGEAPTEYALLQNYPNPFNPNTRISWQSPASCRQVLKVFDMLGSEVRTMVNEEKDAGYHSINFNASELPSGVYLYQLRAGDFIQTKKMVLLR